MQLKLPNSWSQLNLAELMVLMVSSDIVKRVSYVTGHSMDEVRKMPIALVESADEHLTELTSREETKFQKIITLNGEKYGFIPDWDEFSTGEWIDLEGLMDEFWKNADKIMAVLYRRITKENGKSYKIEPYTSKEDYSVFEGMRADHVSGTLLFFWITKNELLHNTQLSLLKAANPIRLARSGGGMAYSIGFRGKIYYQWMRLRNYLSKWYFST